MGIQIEDGVGTGQLAGVSPTGNRLNVSSRSDERIYYISRDNGDSYSWSSGTFDITAADTILLVKNTSTTQKLYITEMWFSSDVETRVQVHCPTVAFTDAGTPVTGTNLNRTSGNVAAATANQDETNNAQGAIVWTGEIAITGAPYHLILHDALILGQGDSVGVDYVANAAACDVTILGFFDVE